MTCLLEGISIHFDHTKPSEDGADRAVAIRLSAQKHKKERDKIELLIYENGIGKSNHFTVQPLCVGVQTDPSVQAIRAIDDC